jgi:hypothetical protein
MRVGVPYVINDRTYFTLRGYTSDLALVRWNETGELVAFDQEKHQEEVLISFPATERGWWQANGRPGGCDQEGQTQEKRVGYDGPAGPIRNVLQIRYRTFSCADVGVESEQFAENIGMLRRVVQSIAGPRTFDLIYARAGSVVIDATPSARFMVSTEQSRDSEFIRATLRIQLTPNDLLLTFPTSQEYDAQLKDEAGNVLWTWSDGQAFTDAEHNRWISRRWETTIMIPKPPSAGEPKAATYTLRAWMTTRDSALAATVPVVITTGLVESSQIH